MPTRSAEAIWEGGPRGKGTFKVASGVVKGEYSVPTRFESAPGTNPEELIAAAHASCFSMALAFGLSRAGHEPRRIDTTAQVKIEQVEGGWKITNIHLITNAEVPGMDEAAFREQAEGAKKGCPVSQALAGTNITLDAKLAK